MTLPAPLPDLPPDLTKSLIDKQLTVSEAMLGMLNCYHRTGVMLREETTWLAEQVQGLSNLAIGMLVDGATHESILGVSDTAARLYAILGRMMELHRQQLEYGADALDRVQEKLHG